MGSVPKKRRLRYKRSAIELALKHGEKLDPDSWEQVWAMLEKYTEPDFLYAIVDAKSGLVKFGRSLNPGMRLDALKTANGNGLKIWAFCAHKSPFTEREVHKLLAADRVSGEWFRFDRPAKEVINSMRAKAGVCVNLTCG